MIANWTDLKFFSDDLSSISAELERRRVAGAVIFPPPERIFAALSFFKPGETKVVIFGQDPYHTPGMANGLAFSVNADVRIPPSLMNIFKELRDDVGCLPPSTGDLSSWAKQGVLLLNTALTVESGQAGSHKDIGWGKLIDEIVAALAEHPKLVWVLWGNNAKKYKDAIPPWHYVIESAHPSPLSAHNGFFGSRPFSKINDNVMGSKIDWVSGAVECGK